MPLLPDIYGFEGLPTFPGDISTFRNGTLMIFTKMFKKVPNYYVNGCRLEAMEVIPLISFEKIGSHRVGQLHMKL